MSVTTHKTFVCSPSCILIVFAAPNPDKLKYRLGGFNLRTIYRLTQSVLQLYCCLSRKIINISDMSYNMRCMKLNLQKCALHTHRYTILMLCCLNSRLLVYVNSDKRFSLGLKLHTICREADCSRDQTKKWVDLLQRKLYCLNPGPFYSCWRNLSLVDHIFRGVAVLATLGQLQFDEAV